MNKNPNGYTDGLYHLTYGLNATATLTFAGTLCSSTVWRLAD